MKTNLKNCIIVILLISLVVSLVYSFNKDTIVNYSGLFINKSIDNCYVIGHKNPDTDTVGSAILCADMFSKVYGVNALPCVSGKINNETKYILDYLNIDEPDVLDNAKNKNIILVDVSETLQITDGIDKANIVAIYDHHSLGNVTSTNPLIIKDLPVGSTATIIYTEYIQHGLDITTDIADLIISCILSDTNNLTSATTSEIDIDAVNYLKKISSIKDMDSYYREMVKEKISYDSMTTEEIFLSDYKEYDFSNNICGIAIIYSSSEEDTLSMIDTITDYLDSNKDKYKNKDIYLMIENMVDQITTVIGYGNKSQDIMLKAFCDSRYVVDHIMARKSEMVPALESAYSIN